MGDVVPDFHAETTSGPIDFHKVIENSWAVLFSHPADFTPVCTTELGRAAILAPEFEKRGVKVIYYFYSYTLISLFIKKFLFLTAFSLLPRSSLSPVMMLKPIKNGSVMSMSTISANWLTQLLLTQPERSLPDGV